DDVSLLRPAAGTERAIDGLRALALLWTMAFHSVWIAGLRVGAPKGEVLALFTSPGWRLVLRADFAVDPFFVLSAYLLPLSLRPARLPARGGPPARARARRRHRRPRLLSTSLLSTGARLLRPHRHHRGAGTHRRRVELGQRPVREQLRAAGARVHALVLVARA